MEQEWITKDWLGTEKMLPEGWESQATVLGAIKRLRKIRSAGMLLRLVLLHVGGAISLKQTVVRGALRGLPAMSGVALFKRLKACTEWLRWMCQELLREQGGRSRWEMPAGGLRMLAVDGTSIFETAAGRGKGKGAEFDVLSWLRSEAEEAPAEKGLWSAGGVELRLCALPVSREAAERERAKLRNAGRKQGREPSERSLELAGYIVLVSTLPREHYSLETLLGLYRLRWQVELSFKRLKSLLAAAHVPKRDPDSARAWMQAKLLICLLIEKLLLDAKVFSPWGYRLAAKQPLV